MESRFAARIALGVAAAVIAVWVTVAVAGRDEPEDVVEEYLSAIADKDVDGALALVSRWGYGVPYGEDAAFLTPEAISDDWWVVSVTETGREHDSARVDAVIAGPGGTAKGEFTVEEDDGEWLLSDPFARVRFPVSPLSYVQVNDKAVPRTPEQTGLRSYSLFPGTYRFYPSVRDVVTTPDAAVVAVFPQPERARSDEREVTPSALTAGRTAVTRAQREVERLVGDCAGFAVEAPPGCPFGTDGKIDTPDGRRVTDLHGLRWTVTSHPTITMADGRRNVPGFTLLASEPGTVTLTGAGVDTDDKAATFTVTCAIDVGVLHASVAQDGAVALAESPRAVGTYPLDTCRRDA